MQELVAGVERIRFDLEADVEQQRGAQLLPFPGMDKLGAAVCEFFTRGLCTRGECWEGLWMGPISLPKILGASGSWMGPSSPLCDFLHAYDVTKMPECYFHSKFGECSNKDCPFLHIDATAGTAGCPWYDQGFCRHALLCVAGPLCKYKHTRRVMCANYLVGFCPEGPKCKFMQYEPGTAAADCPMSPQGAECPWKLARPAPAASRESGCKDVPPAEPPLLVTSATQHVAAQPRDTSSGLPSPQCLLEPGTCFKCGQKGQYAGKCGKNQLEILLGK
ncbi:CPSF4 factor, partial [Chauna torquata]|nr:CPSF4 factor [Chauna torquata]